MGHPPRRRHRAVAALLSVATLVTPGCTALCGTSRPFEDTTLGWFLYGDIGSPNPEQRAKALKLLAEQQPGEGRITGTTDQ